VTTAAAGVVFGSGTVAITPGATSKDVVVGSGWGICEPEATDLRLRWSVSGSSEPGTAVGFSAAATAAAMLGLTVGGAGTAMGVGVGTLAAPWTYQALT
jgi:hypothetical protein